MCGTNAAYPKWFLTLAGKTAQLLIASLRAHQINPLGTLKKGLGLINKRAMGENLPRDLKLAYGASFVGLIS